MKKIKGLKLFLVKEIVERSLYDLNVNEVCMLVFNTTKSCCMVMGNMDHFLILRSMVKGKKYLRMKGFQKAWVTLN